MTVSLVWATPDADALIARIARVSNPANEGNDATAPRLLAYLIRNRHWSPFEMASVCMEVVTTRDIGRQLLRHRSFAFQEFSQRYAEVGALDAAPLRAARMQHPTNRQASVPCEDEAVAIWWESTQRSARNWTQQAYEDALRRGIAKEVARAVLPEGLTPTRLYMAGTVRSWLHFCDLRRGHGTQPEAIAVAEGAWGVLRGVCPAVVQAWEALLLQEQRLLRGPAAHKPVEPLAASHDPDIELVGGLIVEPGLQVAQQGRPLERPGPKVVGERDQGGPLVERQRHPA